MWASYTGVQTATPIFGKFAIETGMIEEIANLKSRGFNDKVSSSKFVRR